LRVYVFTVSFCSVNLIFRFINVLLNLIEFTEPLTRRVAELTLFPDAIPCFAISLVQVGWEYDDEQVDPIVVAYLSQTVRSASPNNVDQLELTNAAS